MIRAKRLQDRLLFWCPGCKEAHAPRVEGAGAWTWNGSLELPTLYPSVDVVGQCHSWVTNGRIEFLPDSSHALKGQTVDLPEWQEP